MGATRGREGRLRAEFAGLYPGIEPDVWTPVEKLLQAVTQLLDQDRSRSGIITGHRLLREEHFEYRGTSPRPDGLPQGSTRLSDAATARAEPEGVPQFLSKREPANRKGRPNE
jgi:hypothetical protein